MYTDTRVSHSRMWSIGAFSSFSLTNIARSPWTPVKGESLSGTCINFSVRHWLYICWWIKFFLCICMIGRNCFFYKCYCVWDKLHIHCFLKSDSFSLKKAPLLIVPGHLFGGVLISSPELDLRRYLWTPAIKWPACALVKLWLQKKEEKSYLLQTWTAQVISRSELHTFIKYFV